MISLLLGYRKNWIYICSLSNKCIVFCFVEVSLMQFLRTELTRGYQLEHDEERFSARREKVYSFMKIPREVENFMAYGFLQVRRRTMLSRG